MKEITSYETDDGRQFDDKEEAEKHEKRLRQETNEAKRAKEVAERKAKQDAELKEKANYLCSKICLPADIFYSFVKGVDALVDEGIIVADKTGMHLMHMDPSGISLVKASIAAGGLASFSIEGTIEIPLNFDRLVAPLKDLAGKLTISAKISDSGKLMAVFSVDSGEDVKMLEMPYTEVRKRDDKEPKVDYTGTFTMKAEPLQQAVARSRKMDDYIRLQIGKGGVTLKAKKENVTYSESYATGKKLVAHKGELETAFNSEFFQNMIATASQDTLITLETKQDQPIRIHYTEKTVQLAYWLAPYVEE